MTKYPQHTFTGRNVDVFNLDHADIHIDDIAHALSMICRFGGHTTFHYSVAQHSVYCAERMYGFTRDAEQALRALLHDANEAYLGDMIRPVKALPTMEVFRNAENAVQRTIYARYDVPTTPIEDDELLTAIDNGMLIMECQQVFRPGWVPSTAYSLHSTHPVRDDWLVDIRMWTPDMAERQFLDQFFRFNHQMKNLHHARQFHARSQ